MSMDLKSNWVPCKLGDVLTLVNGRAYKQHEMLSEGTPILRIQNLNGGKHWFYSNLELPEDKYCSDGDLLYVWSATFGPYIYQGQKAIFHYHIWNVHPSEAINKQFAFYELMRITDAIKHAAHGVAMPHMTKAGMENWELGIPPLPEQKRIADKLDATLARVDACRARLARVAPILKRFRQSVLAAATSGQLTADWREQQGYGHAGNDDKELKGNTHAGLVSEALPDSAKPSANAASNVGWADEGSPTLAAHDERWASQAQPNLRAGLSDSAAELSSCNALPHRWVECKISEAGRVQLGRQRSPKYHHGDNMRPYLRVQNVFENRLDLSDVMEMDFPGEDFTRYKLHIGDILLNEGQSPQFLGRPAMYRGEPENCCFTNTLIRFQAFEYVNPEYALYVFRHQMHSGRYVTEGTITTNIAHLGLGRFANVEFPLPPLEEQTEIVRRVETLFAFADRLEARLASASAAAERLTPSLLAKAFRGELVPQDPNDEPASELLKRLAAQREAMPKAKRGRKGTA